MSLPRLPEGARAGRAGRTRRRASAPAPTRGVRDMLRLWDKSSRAQRRAQLRAFIARCAERRPVDMDATFGPGASLLLSRVVSWLRLTYLAAFAVDTQLAAVMAFFSATEGAQYVTEFLEAGGLVTVLELLLSSQEQRDLCAALRLLLAVAQRGRPYKEQIAACGGLGRVADCLARGAGGSAEALAAARTLMYELAIGNPRCRSQVSEALICVMAARHDGARAAAAQTLSQLLAEQVVQPSAAFVPAAVSLLGSPDFAVHAEAAELLLSLSGGSGGALLGPVLAGVVPFLRATGMGEAAEAVVAEAEAEAEAQAGTETGARASAQVSAVALLARMAAFALPQLQERDALRGLAFAVLHGESQEARKAAAAALATVCRLAARAGEDAAVALVQDLLGPPLYAVLEHTTERNAHELLRRLAQNERRANLMRARLAEHGWSPTGAAPEAEVVALGMLDLSSPAVSGPSASSGASSVEPSVPVVVEERAGRRLVEAEAFTPRWRRPEGVKLLGDAAEDFGLVDPPVQPRPPARGSVVGLGMPGSAPGSPGRALRPHPPAARPA